jgi:hypothetical protein
VDFIILDSPILLSLVYINYYKSNEYPATLYGESFDKMVIDVFNQYQNINIFLKRSDESNHNKKERYQDLTESKELDNTIQSTLDKWNVPYCIVDVGDDAVSEILKLIISK